MSQDIIEACNRRGTIPPGLIEERADRDRYDNEVSLITLADGRKYRMVHHDPANKPRQRATIYAGRGVFVRVKSHTPDRDTIPHAITVAGYETQWGDGDNLGAWAADGMEPVPGVLDALRQIEHDNFDLAIVTVLAAIADVPEAWERREPSRFAAVTRGGAHKPLAWS